ncbi:hypothetical protein LCGC14_2373400 [marine sediment metagenome]|uniref:PEP-CTERM protein-sorting domain-containing protein n=1 Tax=marine sediment metagenome TaxID=412755 RepID=A0A0F9EFG1_9ZZZZ
MRLPCCLLAIVGFSLCVPTTSYAVDLSPGDIVVSDPTADAVLRVDPRTGGVDVISSGGHLYSPHGIALDAAGNVIAVVDYNNVTEYGKIVHVDVSTGAQTVLAAFGHAANPWYPVVLPDGNILYSDYDSPASIRRLDITTGGISIVSEGGLLRHSLNMVLAGQKLFLTDHTGKLYLVDPRIVSVDLVTGAQAVVSSGDLLHRPYGITSDPATGLLYVADQGFEGLRDGRIIRVDPATGSQTLVSEGNLLWDPSDLAFDLNGELLVTDVRGNNPSAIVSVDPATGSQSLLASDVGPSVWGVAVFVPEPTTLFLLVCGAACLGRRRHPRP